MKAWTDLPGEYIAGVDPAHAAETDMVMLMAGLDATRRGESYLAWHRYQTIAAMTDRLRLDPARIRAIADGLRTVAAQPDPVGRVLAEWDRPNGLHIRRVATPIGVLGVIYESRPNVTADAGALAVKSGNAVILRGGSDSIHSSALIHDCMVAGLRQAGLPEAAIQMVPTGDRAAVGAMLRAQGLIDVIIPRGGKALVARVAEDARVPVLGHLEGVCHTYVHASADPAMAAATIATTPAA